MIHFELIFAYWTNYGLTVHSFACGYPIVPGLFIEILPFFHRITFAFFSKNQLTIYLWIYFYTLFCYTVYIPWCQKPCASPVSQMVKNPLAVWETWVQSLSREDPLEKGMDTHSSILAWRISWTVEPGRLQSMGLQGVRHHWPILTSLPDCSVIIMQILGSVAPGILFVFLKYFLAILGPLHFIKDF